MNTTGKWILGIVAVFVCLAVVLLALAIFSLSTALTSTDSDFYEESTGTGADRVAVIELNSVITDSEDIVRQLKKFRNRTNIKSIVLRLNSPGGIVSPSQEIFREVQKTKITGKPIVISMSSVAASGAYYIACGGTKIVANPGTITGSIGVLSEFTNFQELLDKIGIESTTIKSGKYKDAGNPTRKMTDEERMQLQSVVDDVFYQFIEDVASSRSMSVDSVKKLADGRIYSGRQAYALGLVDTLGTFETAISIAGTLGKIEGEPRIVREKRRESLFERIMGGDVSGTLKEIREKVALSAPLEYRMSY